MMTAEENTVKKSLTPKPRSREVENTDYTAFARRVIKALAKRVANGDIEGLPDMLNLASELDDLTRETVDRLRADFGYSWTDIGNRCGMTRQAAQQRWGSNR